MQKSDELDAIVFNEVQLILAEKRTSLSTMRTGIAVFALPLSVLSILVATSKYYNIFSTLHLLVPLFVINLGLIILGSYLIIKSIGRIRRYDQHIEQIKLKHSRLSEFVD